MNQFVFSKIATKMKTIQFFFGTGLNFQKLIFWARTPVTFAL